MPEQVMFLPACFWESEDDESPREAIVTVEDALVVIFSRDDSLQLRLTVYEFKAVAEFVIQEIEHQEEEENEEETILRHPFKYWNQQPQRWNFLS